MSVTSPIQDQINLLKEQLADHEQQIPRNGDKINAITNRISELEYELAQTVQEKEQRDQRQQEIIQTTTSVDILSQMFDSLLPAGQFEVILGPNRYDVLSQDFKQVIQAYVTEALQSAHQQHEFEITHKDERIKLLNDQSLAVQLQLDEANHELEEYKEHNQTLSDDISERNAKLADYSVKLENAISEIKIRDGILAKSQEKIAELEEKLEAAQQPKEAKPSQSFNDMMTAIKTKNQLTADDMLARWNARQKSDDAKIPLPEVKVTEPGNSFRTESDHTAESQGDPIPSTHEVGNLGSQFPVSPPGMPSIAHPMAKDTSELGGSGAEAQVTRQEFEKRVGQLESYVEAVVAKLGLTPDPNNGEGQVA